MGPAPGEPAQRHADAATTIQVQGQSWQRLQVRLAGVGGVGGGVGGRPLSSCSRLLLDHAQPALFHTSFV